MANQELRTLAEGGAFFEAPRWHDGRWWTSDFHRNAVFTVTPDGDEEQQFEVGQQPSGLGWMPDGTLLVVSMRDHRVLRWDGRALHEHASVGEFCGGNLNDMVVHPSGRAYIGNFGFDIERGADPAPANLIVVEPDGTAGIADEGLLFPNGIVLDGDTLIVAETGAARFTAWTVGDDGALSDRRIYAQVHSAPELSSLAATEAQLTFAPDGCTLDAEGHLWAADVLGRRCARVAPGDGGIVDEVHAPDGLSVFACMLGGEDGRTLLLCLSPDFDPVARTAARESILVTTTVEVPHAGLP